MIKVNASDIGSLILKFYGLMSDYLKEVNFYKKNKKYNFNRIDSITTKLYFLKNSIHEFFREKVYLKSSNKITEEDLFDLIIGSIFHEMLHLKEYVYTLESYKDRYDEFEREMEKRKITSYENDFLIHCRQIVDEAKLGLPEKTKELYDLYYSALYQIEGMLKKYRNNSSITRVLYINCNIIKEVYHKGGIEQLYDIIYKCGALSGYFIAGKHFEKQKFTQKAIEAFNKAIDKEKILVKGDKHLAGKLKIINEAKALRNKLQKL